MRKLFSFDATSLKDKYSDETIQKRKQNELRSIQHSALLNRKLCFKNELTIISILIKLHYP